MLNDEIKKNDKKNTSQLELICLGNESGVIL